MINYYVEKEYESLSKRTAQLLIDEINKKPAGLFCFAGGDTPVKTLELLAAAEQAGKVDLSQASFIQLDEWVNIDPNNHGSCRNYLQRTLFDSIRTSEENIHFFNPNSIDLAEECWLANAFIEKKGGLSLALLGIGVNGHLGFNEPGTPFDVNTHVVTLSESTKKVGEKYFEKTSFFERGITLGLAQILAAEMLIVIASGSTKTNAVQTVLKGSPREDCPASGMWLREESTLIIDRSLAETL